MKELKLPYYRLLTHKYCRGGRLPEGQYLTAGGGSARTPYACKTMCAALGEMGRNAPHAEESCINMMPWYLLACGFGRSNLSRSILRLSAQPWYEGDSPHLHLVLRVKPAIPLVTNLNNIEVSCWFRAQNAVKNASSVKTVKVSIPMARNIMVGWGSDRRWLVNERPTYFVSVGVGW